MSARQLRHQLFHLEKDACSPHRKAQWQAGLVQILSADPLIVIPPHMLYPVCHAKDSVWNTKLSLQWKIYFALTPADETTDKCASKFFAYLITHKPFPMAEFAKAARQHIYQLSSTALKEYEAVLYELLFKFQVNLKPAAVWTDALDLCMPIVPSLRHVILGHIDASDLRTMLLVYIKTSISLSTLVGRHPDTVNTLPYIISTTVQSLTEAQQTQLKRNLSAFNQARTAECTSCLVEGMRPKRPRVEVYSDNGDNLCDGKCREGIGIDIAFCKSVLMCLDQQ